MSVNMPVINFPDEIPILHTERLELRAITQDDIEEMFAIYSDPKVMNPFVAELHIDREKTRGLINYLDQGFRSKKLIIWGIFRKEEPRKLIADIGFWRFVPERARGEITGKMSPQLWSQGLSREALEVVDRYGFQEMGLNSIEANIIPENEHSIGLVEGEGYVKEGLVKEHTFCPSRNLFVDTVLLSIRKSEWEKRNTIWQLEKFVKSSSLK